MGLRMFVGVILYSKICIAKYDLKRSKEDVCNKKVAYELYWHRVYRLYSECQSHKILEHYKLLHIDWDFHYCYIYIYTYIYVLQVRGWGFKLRLAHHSCHSSEHVSIRSTSS